MYMLKSKGSRHANTCKKTFPGKGNDVCRGSEAGTNTQYARKQNKNSDPGIWFMYMLWEVARKSR